MEVTREILAVKILDYLNRRLSIRKLTVWAENTMLEGNYEEHYFDEISEALSKIGLLDVESFERPVNYFLKVLKKLNYNTIFGLEPSFSNELEDVYS